MNIRMAGCRDCEQITSGDCGKHGPLQVGSITFQQHPDWPVTFTGSTALAVEIAALRARAEKAEAELAELKAKLTAGLLPPQWEDLDRTINLLPRYHQSVNDQGTPGQPMVRLRDVLLLVRKQLVAPGRSPKETP